MAWAEWGEKRDAPRAVRSPPRSCPLTLAGGRLLTKRFQGAPFSARGYAQLVPRPRSPTPLPRPHGGGGCPGVGSPAGCPAASPNLFPQLTRAWHRKNGAHAPLRRPFFGPPFPDHSPPAWEKEVSVRFASNARGQGGGSSTPPPFARGTRTPPSPLQT